jgi:hypothetical protein
MPRVGDIKLQWNHAWVRSVDCLLVAGSRIDLGHSSVEQLSDVLASHSAVGARY